MTVGLTLKGVSHMPVETQFYKMLPCEPTIKANISILPFCCLVYSPKKDGQKWKFGKGKREEVGE